MISRIIALVIFMGLLAACNCEADVYGERPRLDIPIQSQPSSNEFTVGDTIWWTADFANLIEVRNVDQKMLVEDFQFFAELGIQSLQRRVLIDERTVKLFAQTGLVNMIEPYDNREVLSYAVEMEESNSGYAFKFGMVVLEPGVFTAAIFTSQLNFDFYNHPVLYACGNRKRERFSVSYTNSSTNRDDYENIFQVQSDSIILVAATFEKYADIGSITFTVTE